MANCQKNTDYLILDGTDQVRNIRLSSDGKSLEIIYADSGSVECTFSIDSSNFTGLKINGNNLQITDAISGLNNVDSEAASRASVTIRKKSETELEIIGSEDIIMNLEANIRYDAANDEVTIQY